MSQTSRLRVLFAFAAVLAIKYVVLIQVGGHPLLKPGGELDGAYYVHLASAVRDGDVALLSPESFMRRPVPPFFLPPLYVYFLAAALTVTGGAFEAARLIQVLLGTLAVGLLAASARRWYGAGAAWATGALATFCGLFTFYEVTFLQAALEPVLTALDLYLLTRALQDPRMRWWLASGAALGLHALNRPNVLIVAVGLLLVAGLWTWRSRRATTSSVTWRARDLAAVAVAVVVTISPATIRNWKATGEFVLISSHGGLNFLIGNGDEADGTFRSVMGIEPSVSGQWITAPAVVAREVGHPVTATEASRFFFSRALTWIREHPGRAAMLFVRKVHLTLSASFLTLSHSYPFFSRDVISLLTFLAIGPAMLLALGVCGLLVAPADARGRALFGAYAGLSVLSVAVFFVASRYRLPFQIALTIPAGAMVSLLVTWVRRRDWATLWPVAVALVLVAAGTAWPLGRDDGRAEEQVRMGLYDLQASRTSVGEAWISRGVAHHNAPGVVHLRAAQIYETLNRPADAVLHYQQATVIDPNEPAVRYGLGRALFAAGRDAEAAVELERARTSPALGPSATQMLVLVATRRGDAETASRLASTLDPRTWSADQARRFAAAIGDLGRVDLSVPAWRRAAEASDNALDYERLGIALATLNRHLEALPAFDEAIRRSPRAPSMHLNRAVALATIGRLDDARLEARAALAIDPTYARAKEFLEAIK